MKAGHQSDSGDRTPHGANRGWQEGFSWPLVVSLVLVAVTMAVYWPVRFCGFLGYDDPSYYSANSHVLGGFTWQNVTWALTTGEAANWHPLTWYSHMLDAEIFGNHPSGPHLENLLFHAANVVVLFFLLRRLTRACWRSVAMALLFAVHPLHVESVAWIAERKDLLCALFVLLALLFYTRYVEAAKKENAGALKFYLWCLASFALALMSKPMAVTLPFLLLLLDWWPLDRMNVLAGLGRFASLRPLFVEKIPFLVLSVAVSVITVAVQTKGSAVQTLASFPLALRVENTFVSYARYLGKIFWPQTLVTPYPPPGHWPVTLVALSVLLFTALTVTAVCLARKWPVAFMGWLWFVGMLVPVIGLVQVGTQSMADRYAYLPMVGVLVIAVWGLAALAQRFNVPKGLAAAVLVLIVAACAVKTRAQLIYWQNDGLLFGHALDVTTNNYTARVNLGSWLSKNGRTKEALEQYNAALQITPDDPTALYDTGNALARLGHLDEAVTNYLRALQGAPDKPEVLNNLGFALMEQKQLPGAITNFEAALKIKPDYADAHNNLATALFRQGQYEDAAQEFFAALQLEPDNAMFCANLGDAMVRLGRPDKAEECYQKALQLDPGNSKLAAKLRSLGEPVAH